MHHVTMKLTQSTKRANVIKDRKPRATCKFNFCELCENNNLMRMKWLILLQHLGSYPNEKFQYQIDREYSVREKLENFTFESEVGISSPV